MSEKSIVGSCHCGAVEITFTGTPKRLVSCNCSICRRYRTLWAHGTDENIAIKASQNATLEYVWGDKSIGFHSCKTCGCTTHWVSLTDDSPKNMAANMALADPQDIAEIRVRHFDGADTWEFLD